MSETLFFIFYRSIGWPLVRALFEILSLFLPKVKKGLELRKPVDGRAPWIKGLPPTPPTYWFHCASGEFEYAKPVITQLKERLPSAKVVVTYFSPTYADNIRKFAGVDWVVPLPWDTPRDLNVFMDSYRPAALLVARTDVWPEMARQARLRGLQTVLFSASLGQRSGRLRGLGRWATRASLNQLDAIFCVSDDDVGLFESLSLRGPQISRAGDTRYDQVLARLAVPKPLREDVFAALRDRRILVCGSTWPEDEKVLLPALAPLADSGIAGCIVPHEPNDEHLAALDRELAAQGLQGVLYSDPTAPEKLRSSKSTLVIDQVGLLAEIYQKAEWAFVGGSFRKNVHSVMEPLATGCLTFVGPFYENNREAILFHELGFVKSVTSSSELEQDILASSNELKSQIKEAVRARTGSSLQLVDWVTSRP